MILQYNPNEFYSIPDIIDELKYLRRHFTLDLLFYNQFIQTDCMKRNKLVLDSIRPNIIFVFMGDSLGIWFIYKIQNVVCIIKVFERQIL